jgi:1,2-beta-oligoglucan phosphorylase
MHGVIHRPPYLQTFANKVDVRAMPNSPANSLITPRRDDLGLMQIVNKVGCSISVLPNGALFAIEHTEGGRRIMINQSLALPIASGMGRLCLRISGTEPMTLPIVGPEARCRVGAADDRFVWTGEQCGVHHQVSLSLHPDSNVWLWRIDVVNQRDRELPCDAVFIQDLGLADPNFVMSNEAYASQYLDHYPARHPRMNYILMSRQNLPQGGTHPWVAHGCLEGAAGFATDFREVMGPAYRDADHFDCSFGISLPSSRLQFETACAALQSEAVALAPGAATCWTFFGLYKSDHPAASTDADLKLIDVIERACKDWAPRAVALAPPARSFLHDAPSAVGDALGEGDTSTLSSVHACRTGGRPASFFLCSGGNT